MGAIIGRAMPDDFEQMWAALAPLGRSAASGGYFRQPFTPAESELRTWFGEQCRARGLEVEADGNGNFLGWWTASVEPVDATGRPRRLAPRLGPRRWGVRRPAGRGLLAGRDRPAARAGGAAAPTGGRGRLRRGGGIALRARLPGFAAGDRRDDSGPGPGAARPGRRTAAGRDGLRRPLPGTRESGLGGPDRMLPGAARRAGPRPRGARRGDRAGHARSGRTAATASTSREPPTTPGPRGWRIGTTRC